MPRSNFDTPDGEDIDINSEEVVHLSLGHDEGTTLIEMEDGRIIGKLELPYAVGLEAVRTPDSVHQTSADARFAGHQRGRPVGRLAGRLLMRSGGYPCDNLWGQSRDTRRAGLVALQAFHPFLHEPLLPAPDARLGRICPTHDLAGAYTVSALRFLMIRSRRSWFADVRSMTMHCASAMNRTATRPWDP